MVLKIIFTCIILLHVFSGCTSNPTEINNNEVKATKEINAKALYTLHCEACHGMDGTKGISGAANLRISKLTTAQIKNTIKNGNEKGMMPFKDLISSEKEIDALTEFVKSLRN